jgi:hypothetical protein
MNQRQMIRTDALRVARQHFERLLRESNSDADRRLYDIYITEITAWQNEILEEPDDRIEITE